MRLSARQIELFQMAYRMRSTRKAAEAMFVSQPAISRAVAELEAEIGVRLFDRSGRKFEPNAAARSLNAAVKLHYQGLDRVIEAAEAIAKGTAGHLRVAALPAVADTLVAQGAARLMVQHPRLRIDVDMMGERECLVALRSGNIDCAVICSNPGDPGLVCTLIAETKPVAALSRGDPLAHADRLSLAQLVGADLVMLPPDSPFRRSLEHALTTANLAFSVRAEARTQATLAEFVARGVGRAVIDPLTASRLHNSGLVVLPLDGNLVWPIQALASASAMDLPVLRLFVGALVGS